MDLILPQLMKKSAFSRCRDTPYLWEGRKWTVYEHWKSLENHPHLCMSDVPTLCGNDK